MTDQGKKQRLYDVKEYKVKIIAALENLKQTEQPGEISGKATKTELLQATKSEIEALLKEGYTLKQIANAISNNGGFGILPKSITQLFPDINLRQPLKGRKTTTTPTKKTDNQEKAK